MFKIVVFDTDKEDALILRESIKEVCISKKISFQLSTYYLSPRVICENLVKNVFEYDILCLSICADNNYAFQIAHQLRKSNSYSSIIFLSETKEYVFDTFKYKTSDYLLKPLIKELFSVSIGRIINDLSKNNDFFTIKSKEILARIPYKNIDYFESHLKTVKIVLNDEFTEKIFISKLDDVHNLLPQNIFIRCHQSYIINLNNVRYLNREYKKFILNSGREVFISKRSYQKVFDLFVDFQNQKNHNYDFSFV